MFVYVFYFGACFYVFQNLFKSPTEPRPDPVKEEDKEEEQDKTADKTMDATYDTELQPLKKSATLKPKQNVKKQTP